MFIDYKICHSNDDVNSNESNENKNCFDNFSSKSNQKSKEKAPVDEDIIKSVKYNKHEDCKLII